MRMGDYLRALLLAACITVLAELLLPQKNERMRRLLEFALSLLVLLVICRPLVDRPSLDGWLPDLDASYPTYEGEILTEETRSAMEAAVARGIAADLSQRYGLRSEAVRAVATLCLQDGELAISSLTIYVSREGALLDLYEVQDYATRAYQTDCEVRIDGA